MFRVDFFLHLFLSFGAVVFGQVSCLLVSLLRLFRLFLLRFFFLRFFFLGFGLVHDILREVFESGHFGLEVCVGDDEVEVEGRVGLFLFILDNERSEFLDSSDNRLFFVDLDMVVEFALVVGQLFVFGQEDFQLLVDFGLELMFLVSFFHGIGEFFQSIDFIDVFVFFGVFSFVVEPHFVFFKLGEEGGHLVGLDKRGKMGLQVGSHGIDKRFEVVFALEGVDHGLVVHFHVSLHFQIFIDIVLAKLVQNRRGKFSLFGSKLLFGFGLRSLFFGFGGLSLAFLLLLFLFFFLFGFDFFDGDFLVVSFFHAIFSQFDDSVQVQFSSDFLFEFFFGDGGRSKFVTGQHGIEAFHGLVVAQFKGERAGLRERNRLDLA